MREAGVSFRAPNDGRKVFLGPEESMEIQARLGSDIAMAFDECTPHPADHPTARASMELSMRWAARSRASYGGPGRLFGIVQGGMFPDLRLRSLAALEQLDFDVFDVRACHARPQACSQMRIIDSSLSMSIGLAR